MKRFPRVIINRMKSWSEALILTKGIKQSKTLKRSLRRRYLFVKSSDVENSSQTQSFEYHSSTHSNNIVCHYEGCHYRTGLEDLMNRHINNRHLSDKPFKCDSCDKSFGTRYCLNLHESYSHQMTGKQFHCNAVNCHSVFKCEERLKRHIRMRHSPYVCDFPECGKRFVRKTLLERHKEKHLREGFVYLWEVSSSNILLENNFSKTCYKSWYQKIFCQKFL